MSIATLTRKTASSRKRTSCAQRSLFDLDLAATQYTAANRVADRQLCMSYLKQWAGSFKKDDAITEISIVDFEAAAARLAQ